MSISGVLVAAYQRNLLYQQIGFKWKSYCHLRSILGRLHSVHGLRKTLFITVFFLVYLLDFTLGSVALLAIQRYGLQEWLKGSTSVYTLTMLHWTEQLVAWMMGIPAGLKLNVPLDHFLGTRFLTILQFWEYFYSDFIATYLTGIVSSILLLNPLGITVFLTALHDFLKFLNLFLICFFLFSMRILSLQISALASLARLFMGTKWNILRKRVDSCDYDISQLLLGTILFTILLFLFPTTSMYFLIFLLLRVVQFMVQLLLRMLTVSVNKVTVTWWRMLEMCCQDDPITRMRVTVNLDGFVKDEMHTAEVVLSWNGGWYTVEEMRDTLKKYSIHSVHEALDGSWSCVGMQHCMLNWLGTLPL